MGISVCRNTKLANVFYRLGLIEAYGTGIRKIMNAYSGTGLTPQIETSDNAFKIILPNLNVHEGQKKPVADKSVGNEPIQVVMALAKEHGSITRKEVEKKLGISQTTCGRLLKQMVENGQIVQVGKGRNTHYYPAD